MIQRKYVYLNFMKDILKYTLMIKYGLKREKELNLKIG